MWEMGNKGSGGRQMTEMLRNFSTFPPFTACQMHMLRQRSQQPSVSPSGLGLFMKNTKTFPAQTEAVVLPRGRYAAVHHAGEFEEVGGAGGEDDFRGSVATPTVVQLLVSSESAPHCQSVFLPVNLAPRTHSFFHVESECLCSVSTFLQRSDGYSAALTPPPRFLLFRLYCL